MVRMLRICLPGKRPTGRIAGRTNRRTRERNMSMSGYSIDIEKKTIENTYFREVLYTAPNLQLVVMTLKPGEEIGMETHEHGDQFFRVEAGEGKAILDGETHQLTDGSIVIIPEKVEHNIVNTSADKDLKVYTIYTPPEHKDGVVHKTKAEADADEDDHA
jgi:mannose-6-phosphate isomerase-like protein (cupin superfamily)